jgi:hypothetical protein
MLIVSLIAAIVLTDLLFDGFRFALVVPADSAMANE